MHIHNMGKEWKYQIFMCDSTFYSGDSVDKEVMISLRLRLGSEENVGITRREGVRTYT